MILSQQSWSHSLALIKRQRRAWSAKTFGLFHSYGYSNNIGWISIRLRLESMEIYGARPADVDPLSYRYSGLGETLAPSIASQTIFPWENAAP